MEKSLFRYIWKYSSRQQAVILLITTLSFPMLYVMLELPKMIVNDAIQGEPFPKSLFGLQFDQVPYLFTLCFAFLALVFLNNGVKYTLNVYKGLTGERMLRRLRFDLFRRVLRFRLPQFRRVSSSEIIPMITSEVEDLGGFIGDAIAVPAFQGGTLMVYLAFIFVQDPLLGVAAVSLYPVQAYIIPRLQKRVVLLSRERVRNVRSIADKIGEGINGVTEIHANDTSAWHLSDLSGRLYTNFKIRYDIFQRKYMIKFVNNFINQLTPFFFYSIGGYLVIQGNISFGALVAVLAAYKDLAGPWKELLQYYQTQADCSVKYQTVIENFDASDLYPLERLTSDEVKALEGSLKLSHVTFGEGDGRPAAQAVSFEVPPASACAVIGDDQSGRAEVLQLAAGLLSPDSGRVEIGAHNLEELTAATLGRLVAYVHPGSFIFSGTIRDNLYYGLRHRPVTVAEAVENPAPDIAHRRMEAEVTGNSRYDITAAWEDYSAAGAPDMSGLQAHALAMLDRAGMGDDIYRMGLQARIDPGRNGDLVARMLRLRAAIAERVQSDPQLQDLIELWDFDKFNRNASLAENLLYGVPADPAVSVDMIPEDPKFLAFLKTAGLHAHLVDIGRRTAETMVELFGSVKADSSLLESFSFISPDQMPEIERILRKSAEEAPAEADAMLLIGIALKLVCAKHRLGIIDEAVETRVVEARKRFHAEVGTADGRYVLFDRQTYVGPLSIEDNLIFGKPRGDRRDARERIEQLIGTMVGEMDLRGPILEAGLDFNVGVSGSRLTASQRQRISLVRAMLKRPKVLILDEIAAGAGDADASLRAMIRSELDGRTLLFGTGNAWIADEFDHRITLSGGRVVESAPPPAEREPELAGGQT